MDKATKVRVKRNLGPTERQTMSAMVIIQYKSKKLKNSLMLGKVSFIVAFLFRY